MNTKRRMMRGRPWLVMLLLLAGSMTGYAQSNCFTYEDEGMTIIKGLTSAGQAATSLTIPKEVTTVESEAFYYSSAEELALVIEAGGNPKFEPNLFGFSNTVVSPGVYEPKPNRLSDIRILGSSMTVANIRALLVSLVARGALETVYIEGYSGTWIDIIKKEEPTAEESTLLAVLATKVKDDSSVNYVSVALPAAMVTTQEFGDATVCGRFEITKEVITFCGNATFEDKSTDSNILFYVADYRAKDGRMHIQRVNYIAKGEGVLIHNLENTSDDIDLPRISTGVETGTDASLYASNMLVGVTEPTTIGSTDGDKTNYILKDGAFHPTDGGIIGANKAYLQIPTSAAREMLTISFDEESTDIKTTDYTDYTDSGTIYDLSGRRIESSMLKKGVYIKNGKKYVIR